MPKIHHATTGFVERWAFDPDRGPVLRSEMTRQDPGTITLVDNGTTYERGSDGAFDVPEELAARLLRQPDWHVGPSPFAKAEEISPAGQRTRKVTSPRE